MDRLESLPRTRELREQPGMPPLAELRKRIGPELSDEEFLLRATMPAGQVDAMKAAGPAPPEYDPNMVPVMHLIRELAKRRDLTHISVEKPGFKLELSQLVQAGAGP
jgi:oxaloacetate decarboxylase alpha subunit